MPYICTVKSGNLLKEEDATFIVNASNTVLQLGSGVSAAFKQVCGIKLQIEMMEKYKSINQKLHKGDVIATSAGDARNFKYALHAAVMDYNTGIPKNKKLPTLENIVTILKNIVPYLEWYADNHQGTTIKLVLPLMGCGVGNLSTKDVLEIYKKFFEQDVVFDCEIVIYGYSPKDYSLAKSICETYDYLLQFQNQHLILTLKKQKWLIDTGSPASFGNVDSIVFAGQNFKLSQSYGTLNTKELSSHINLELNGLIGVDILNHFDIIFNLSREQISISKNELTLEGRCLEVESFMGIPIIQVKINNDQYKMFFDTGAQIAYWKDDRLKNFLSRGTVSDFYPGFGKFETDSYLLEIIMGEIPYKIPCGSLPPFLKETLMLASVEGIMSNVLMPTQVIGYFPKRQQLVLKDSPLIASKPL